jgi:hypothetical protein
MRKRMGRFDKTEELVEFGVFLSSDCAFFIIMQTMLWTEVLLANGANQ